MTVFIRTEQYPNGALKLKVYYNDDKLHREDGPAREVFFIDGKIWHQGMVL
jgi:hypothetical protein